MKTDAQLKVDVEMELVWEPVINPTTIGVDVKDGIVTLTGHLHSYMEKLGAEQAVQRVLGVKGLAVEIDVILPGASQRTDADIAHAANDALYWNSMIPQERITVMTENGWITLSGEVDWAYQRAAAESAIRTLRGVKGVLNQVQLRNWIQPHNVKTQIEAALQRSANLDARSITVSVDGSRVTLDGKVHSVAERRIVKDATWSAPGVSAVVDHLSVAP